MQDTTQSTPPRPTIVVLCGSTRYWDALAEANSYETAAGRIVLAPGCDMKSAHALWADRRQADRLKAVLDDLHMRKIDRVRETCGEANAGGVADLAADRHESAAGCCTR